MRTLSVILIASAVACGAESSSKSSSLDTPVVPGGGHTAEASEMTALLAAIVASHQLALEHERETQATRTPNLRHIDRGESVLPVDADVVRSLPACVSVEKSFELSTQTYSFEADFSGCAEGSGTVRGTQVVSGSGVRITETHSLSVEDYAAPSLTLSGQFERTRFFEADAGYDRVLSVQVDVELGVTLVPSADSADEATSWAMSLDHEVTMTPSPEGMEVVAEGMVELEAGEGSFALQGAWSPAACISGGWTSGTLALERDGQTVELPLGCDASSWEVARYETSTVQALRENPVLCHECSLEDVDLRYTFLAGAELDEAWLTDVDLSGATLFGATAEDAIVTSVNLTDADLTYARFDNSFFTANTYERTLLVATSFNEANLVEPDLSTATLNQTSFDEATVTGASFVGRHLSSVDIEDADLTGSDFTGATLIENNCERTDFSSVDFTDANLFGSNLHESTLNEALWANTICADGSNSDRNDGTCVDRW